MLQQPLDTNNSSSDSNNNYGSLMQMIVHVLQEKTATDSTDGEKWKRKEKNGN